MQFCPQQNGNQIQGVYIITSDRKCEILSEIGDDANIVT
jgi:hypothetical protein